MDTDSPKNQRHDKKNTYLKFDFKSISESHDHDSEV
jgi:hypothetical protein